MPPLDYEYRPGTGAMPPAAEARLNPENKISEGQRVFDSDPNISVLWLKAAGDLPDKIFLKNDVYGTNEAGAVNGVNEGSLGEKLASFDNSPLGVLRHIGLFSNTHPQGIDLVKFAFKARTIVDIEFKDGALILTGDPTRPLEEKRLPQRLWQADFPTGLAPI